MLVNKAHYSYVFDCTQLLYRNREIFMYENFHVLNIRVNKFSRVPLKNIFNTKICQVEIAVHVAPSKRLLAMYVSLFCYKNS